MLGDCRFAAALGEAGARRAATFSWRRTAEQTAAVYDARAERRVMAMRVSVIVLNYNGRQWLDGCLNALAAQQGAPSFEVIVADNGSTDGSIVWLAKHHPHVRVLRNGTNLGFAAGNNAGAAQATGEWLVFLNNDTIPEPDWLAELCRPLAEHPDVTMATSRIVFIDDPAVVDSAGDGYLRAGGAYKRGHRAEVSGFLESREVFGACGGGVHRSGATRSTRSAASTNDSSWSTRTSTCPTGCGWPAIACWYAAARSCVTSAAARSGGAVRRRSITASATWNGPGSRTRPAPLMLRTAAAHAVYSLAGLAALSAHAAGSARVARQAGGASPACRRCCARRRQMRPLRRVEWRAIDAWLDRGWLRLKRREKAGRGSARPDDGVVQEREHAAVQLVHVGVERVDQIREHRAHRRGRGHRLQLVGVGDRRAVLDRPRW